MSGIYGLNRDFAAYSINRQLGLSLDWTIYDRRQIEVLMRENQSPFTNIAYDNLGDGARIAKQLQNQLAQSVILGESQQRLTQRIRSVTGVELNRARRIAQTERVRVQSEGRQLGVNEATAMGVEMDKQWIARLVNTRDTHAELHGTVIPASESFVTKNGPLEFPGDPDAPAAEIVNCYCFVKPMVKSVSPELAAHREKFHEDMKFEEFRAKRLDKQRKMEYDINNKIAEHNEKMRNDEQPLNIITSSQSRHILGSGYIQGRSYIYGDLKDAQDLVNKYAGKGKIEREPKAGIREIVQSNTPIGVSINPNTGVGTVTSLFKIHYSKKGTHIVPHVRRK